MSNVKPNLLYTGDNLYIMNGMNSESVDLIYIDPPFNSKRFYNAPIGSKAAGAMFKDTWTWQDVDMAYLDKLYSDYPALASYIYSVQKIHSKSMASYLCFMAQRIMEMHRILKPTGSFYLHVDPTACHYLKIILDRLFGQGNFRNEIVWCYRGAGYPKKDFGKRHDVIFRYTKTKSYLFNVDAIREEYAPATKERFKHYIGNVRSGGDYGQQKLNPKGRHPDDWWQIQPIAPSAKERTGYPTQKPLALLYRIVEASSNKGDIVFDPFCGCATTMVAAEHKGRKWIGIDIELQARELVISRLAHESGELFKDFVHTKQIPKRTDIATVTLSKAELKKAMYKEQNGLCGGCMNKTRIELCEIDHIIPKSKGGQDNMENLQLLCGSCNKIKGDRPMEYLMAKIAAVASVSSRISY